jgi:hypothetical protein
LQVIESIIRHFEVGVIIKVITCDGTKVNLSLFNKLGASVHVDNIVPYFQHPVDNSLKVYVTLDYCHMLKLVRNNLKHFGCFYTKFGVVKFEHFVKLVEFQEKLDFKLENKLNGGHINFERDTMKTRLVVQLFSRSVAKSLKFLMKIGVLEFIDAHATIKFCEIMDEIFDILNTRSHNAEMNKAAINRETWKDLAEKIPFFIEFLSNIEVYKDKQSDQKINILKHQLKTGVLGLILDL